MSQAHEQVLRSSCVFRQTLLNLELHSLALDQSRGKAHTHRDALSQTYQ